MIKIFSRMVILAGAYGMSGNIGSDGIDNDNDEIDDNDDDEFVNLELLQLK